MSTSRTGWVIIMCVVGNVLTLMLSIGYVLQLRGQLCTVVTSQVRVYQETPPSTAAGQNAREAWGELRHTFKCA